MGLKIIALSVAESLTLDECRQHLRVQPYEVDSNGDGVHPDDSLIMSMQSAARANCENFLGLSITQKLYEMTLDQFPAGPIVLPMSPLMSVESVSVGMDSDALLDEGTYTVDDFSSPPRILPVTVWPTVTAAPNLIRIRFVTGYGDGVEGDPLPPEIRAAILLTLGSLYAHREDETDKVLTTIPTGAEALLRPLRVRLGMA